MTTLRQIHDDPTYLGWPVDDDDVARFTAAVEVMMAQGTPESEAIDLLFGDGDWGMRADALVRFGKGREDDATEGRVVDERTKTMTRTRREQTIEQVAGLIADNLAPHAESAVALRHAVWAANGSGWTYEVRWCDEEYINDTDYSRVEGAILSAADLERALVLAETWARQ